MTHNFLKLNADKTEVLVIGFRAQLLKFNLPSIKIAGVRNVAVRSDPIKNLGGVMFDPEMSMNAQVTNIVKAVNFHLINISRKRRFLTTEATKLAIHALVTSQLDYCRPNGISNRVLTQLQNIQRTSARLVTNRRKFDSITYELIQLHWLPVKQRIDVKFLSLVYKDLHNQTPGEITNKLQVNIRQRRLRSSCSSSLPLVEPQTRCVSFADRSFSVYAPKIWNTLSEYIKDSNYEISKSLLNSHLFHEACEQ
ncbi:hypothetical protein HOLleu_20059 [Holothuria leucospilota]|uniref:Uncharacterized protein n=1 Tax=Holothuria leucospilota TaxID=206669 RepID=A0A9Q1C0W3_HOLLE|nr:hypothetical protein HOLleu_20059 [Holothuria leucospilota]